MVTVSEAEKIISGTIKSYGTALVPLADALGYVLAEDLYADRDLPPYNRVTMDGIAISFEGFEKGIREFKIKGIQAAGDLPMEIDAPNECVEIMTGAALPESTDTVIRYEDLQISNGIASVFADMVNRGQSIHRQGSDSLKNKLVLKAGAVIDPVVINMAAATGRSSLPVKKLPRTLIVSSGDELVEIDEVPNPYQIRRSNNYTIQAALRKFRIEAEMIHLPDDVSIIETELKNAIEGYELIILSGGVSMGKFDHIPAVLNKLSVTNLFHKVKQRPGKPFWFGTYKNKCTLFALPGNPVSGFMCLHRYIIPWLKKCLAINNQEELFAALAEDMEFKPELQYFAQVKLSFDARAQLMAVPVKDNGSGDFVHLINANAFIELPLEQSNFSKGEIYRVWKF